MMSWKHFHFAKETKYTYTWKSSRRNSRTFGVSWLGQLSSFHQIVDLSVAWNLVTLWTLQLVLSGATEKPNSKYKSAPFAEKSSADILFPSEWCLNCPLKPSLAPLPCFTDGQTDPRCWLWRNQDDGNQQCLKKHLFDFCWWYCWGGGDENLPSLVSKYKTDLNQAPY